MNRFVIGDIHGRYTALKQVLAKSRFNYNKDMLIVLGDIVDGGEDVYNVIEELLKIKNLVYIFGNHDLWFIKHIENGWREEIWLSQGGRNTLASYKGSVPITHQHFLNKGKYYYILDNMAFVHGGFIDGLGIERTPKQDLVWDRSLINEAMYRTINPFKKVFVGHTTTQTYNKEEPIKFNNLVMMDTGAGWNGRLSIMNIDTEEYWQSDKQEPIRGKDLNDETYLKFLQRLRR